MGRHTIESDSLVDEKWSTLAVSRVPPDTWNPVGRRGDHPPSLNTTQWPIVNSTVKERWKEPREGSEKNLKPCAYKHIKHVNVWYGTFCRMVRRVNVTGKVKDLRSGAEARASLNRASSQLYSTRNRVTYPWSGWSEGKTSWRTEPTPVEMVGDELWIAEKFQTNPEIAGSLRNSFRASLDFEITAGKALNELGAERLLNSIKLWMADNYNRESVYVR